ncbi:TlpA family protein disulfide reductase [Patescibacteria group bacterium]|nr:TlpA family protein disulfide reductase [Patescibacteria group bacterium]
MKVIGILLILLVGIGGFFLLSSMKSGGEGNTTELALNSIKEAPQISFISTEGQEISLSQFRGRVVILQAMAAWCPSCKLQAGEVKKVFQEFQEKGLVVMSFDIQPERSTPADLLRFQQTYGADGEWYFGFQSGFINLYGIKSLDETVIVDKNSDIIYQDSSITTAETLRNIVARALTN